MILSDKIIFRSHNGLILQVQHLNNPRRDLVCFIYKNVKSSDLKKLQIIQNISNLMF